MVGLFVFRVETGKILFDAAAFGAVADLADLFGGEFFVFAAFVAAGHDAAEGFDFGDDGCEVEFADLGFDLVGVFIGDGSFAEVGFCVEPTDVDVAGVMGDEVAALICSAVLFFEGGAGDVSSGAVRGEGEEFLLIISEDEEDGLGHVEGDEADEWSALVILPGGGGTFAVVEEVAPFPDEVVFIAEGLDGFGSDAFEEALVNAFVIGAGPAGDVLEGVPVGEPFG